jgi:hypothetical protein
MSVTTAETRRLRRPEARGLEALRVRLPNVCWGNAPTAERVNCPRSESSSIR